MIVGNSIIGEKGKITIPKEIRVKLGLVQGDRLIFDLKGDKIIITKSQSNSVSEILDKQNPWKIHSTKYQRDLREEWD